MPRQACSATSTNTPSSVPAARAEERLTKPSSLGATPERHPPRQRGDERLEGGGELERGRARGRVWVQSGRQYVHELTRGAARERQEAALAIQSRAERRGEAVDVGRGPHATV